MLTEHASNAFLKTLEEPPPHAIFILCTTEPHKILPTIISRCQRFDFRRLTSDSIVERLRGICLEEGVDAEGEALTALAHSAGGSLRDAENLLEQLVVSYGKQIGIAEVYEMLGLGQGERALEFTRYLLMGNTSSALSAINRAAWDGVDLRQLHRQAVDLLRGSAHDPVWIQRLPGPAPGDGKGTGRPGTKDIHSQGHEVAEAFRGGKHEVRRLLISTPRTGSGGSVHGRSTRRSTGPQGRDAPTPRSRRPCPIASAFVRSSPRNRKNSGGAAPSTPSGRSTRPPATPTPGAKGPWMRLPGQRQPPSRLDP